MLHEHQASDVTAAPQVGGEAGGVLPRQVTQVAESTRQRLQERERHLSEGRAQRL